MAQLYFVAEEAEWFPSLERPSFMSIYTGLILKQNFTNGCQLVSGTTRPKIIRNEYLNLNLQTESQIVGKLELDFSNINREKFKQRFYKRKWFAKLKYEVQIVLNGVLLAYRLIVPELGRWWNYDEKLDLLDPTKMCDRHWGYNYHEAKATMTNVAAAFDVSGTYFSSCSHTMFWLVVEKTREVMLNPKTP